MTTGRRPVWDEPPIGFIMAVTTTLKLMMSSPSHILLLLPCERWTTPPQLVDSDYPRLSNERQTHSIIVNRLTALVSNPNALPTFAMFSSISPTAVHRSVYLFIVRPSLGAALNVAPVRSSVCSSVCPVPLIFSKLESRRNL